MLGHCIPKDRRYNRFYQTKRLQGWARDKDRTASWRTEALALLAIADEFVLEPLKAKAEQSCIAYLQVQVNNVKEMLLAAERHSARALKDACYEVVKRNASSLMVDPSFMKLSSDSPELWKELCTFLAPDQDEYYVRPNKRGNDSPTKENEDDRPTKRVKTGLFGWLFDRSGAE